MVGTGFGVTKRALVTPLTTMADAEGARENVDPEIVRGWEPGARVWLPMMNWEALLAEMVWESSVMVGWPVKAPAMMEARFGGETEEGEGGDGGGGWITEVAPLTISALADGARENVDDSMTVALPPGIMVWLPYTKFEDESAAMVDEAITMTGGLNVDGGFSVWVGDCTLGTGGVDIANGIEAGVVSSIGPAALTLFLVCELIPEPDLLGGV